MTMQPITEQIPIRLDKFGQYRVGQTNLLLDLVVRAYLNGETPDSIIDSYPTLSLDDVYLTIGYYIRHRVEIDTHLQQQMSNAMSGELEDKSNFDITITREILLERLYHR